MNAEYADRLRKESNGDEVFFSKPEGMNQSKVLLSKTKRRAARVPSTTAIAARRPPLSGYECSSGFQSNAAFIFMAN